MENKFQPGDIIATRSNSFLSRAIRWAMSKYRPQAPSFSHNAVVFRIFKKMFVAEALFWGVKIWPLKDSGYLTNPQCIILRHKEGFLFDQLNAIAIKMLALDGTRYQYENLPLWLAKILVKVSLFRRNNEKAIYCSELAAIAINAAYPGTFPKPNVVSPADHTSNPIYEIIDINGIMK